MASVASPLFQPDQPTDFRPIDFVSAGPTYSTTPFGLSDPSTFDPGTQLVDPTNTGDTGALQNISTPLQPSQNNPETAGSTDLGAVLNNAINAGFSAWQLASQPKGTPKTVTTTVGGTKVVSGQPSLFGGIFGPSAAGSTQSSNLVTIVVLLLVGLLVYKLVVK